MVALPPFRGVTRQILLLAGIVFFSLLVLGLFSADLAGTIGGLCVFVPAMARRLIWEFVTYPFINTGAFSFLFAALSVWFFGSTLEDELGSRWMAEFFFACTIGGAVLAAIVSFTVGLHVLGLGPGEVGEGLWPFALALLLAFARLHPDQELNFNFILRVKAKYMAMLYLLVYLAVALSSRQRFDAMLVIANALAGWLYLRFAPRRGVRFAAAENLYGMRNAWYRAKRKRAAKKFTVYMQKQGKDVSIDESGRYVDPSGRPRDPNDRRWMN